jgi:hypothetical protein
MHLVRLQRTREWCEPGQSQRQKILPERELKSNLLSKGTGLISRYPRYGLQQDSELLRNKCHASLDGRCVECGWYRGGQISSLRPKIGTKVFHLLKRA